MEAWVASALTAVVQAPAMRLPALSAWVCPQLPPVDSRQRRLVVTRLLRLDKVLLALATEWVLQQAQLTIPLRPHTPLLLQATAARALPHLPRTRLPLQVTLLPLRAILPRRRATLLPLHHTVRRRQLTEMVPLQRRRVTARRHRLTRQHLRHIAPRVPSTMLVELRTRPRRRATAQRRLSTALQARLRGTITLPLPPSTRLPLQARELLPSGHLLAPSSRLSKYSDNGNLL